MTQFAGMLTDLDGTLMVTDTVSHRVASAITRVAKIIPVTIATGRRATDVIEYAERLGLKTPQICNGGATLLDPLSGNVLWSSHLSENRGREIVEFLCSKGINFIATHPAGDAVSLSQVRHWDLTRISAMDIPEATADELVAKFAAANDLNIVKVYLHYNGWWAVDFTALGVHKGKAARILAQRMGVKPEQFIAAGDSFNDLPMLKVAGFRIAMAAAPAELKAVADYVAPPVEEDGLAVAVEEAVLPALLARQG